MTQWINFKLLKEQLDFGAILKHYNVKTVADGPHHVKCSCPFHDDKRPSMGIDLTKKIWQCFACKTSGNVLDFITRMEGMDPAEPNAIRKGAEVAMEIMSADRQEHEAKKPSGVRRFEKRGSHRPKPIEPIEAEEEAEASETPDDDGLDNPVLTFELKLEPCPASVLKAQSVSKETAAAFGIGLAKRGLMKDRVCFPLHNLGGELIGYAGYWADGNPPEGTPLWLWPPKFNEDRFVFNAHRIPDDIGEVVIAASFWDCVRAAEKGLACVAWLSETPSAFQLEWLETSSAATLALICDAALEDDVEPGMWLVELARRAPTRIIVM